MAKVERGSDLWKALDGARWAAFLAHPEIEGYTITGEMKNQMILLDKEELKKSNLVLLAYKAVKERLLLMSMPAFKKQKDEKIIQNDTFIIKTLDKELNLNKISAQPQA
jgi:hypothetical protein